LTLSFDFYQESSFDLILDHLFPFDFEQTSELNFLIRFYPIFTFLFLNSIRIGQDLQIINSLNNQYNVTSSLLVRNDFPEYVNISGDLVMSNFFYNKRTGEITFINNGTVFVNSVSNFVNQIGYINVSNYLNIRNQIDSQNESLPNFVFDETFLGT